MSRFQFISTHICLVLPVQTVSRSRNCPWSLIFTVHLAVATDKLALCDSYVRLFGRVDEACESDATVVEGERLSIKLGGIKLVPLYFIDYWAIYGVGTFSTGSEREEVVLCVFGNEAGMNAYVNWKRFSTH